MENAFLLSLDVKKGSSVSREWAPAVEKEDLFRLNLWPLPDDSLERFDKEQGLIVGARSGESVPDVIGSFGGPFVVSPKLRGFLDELEPGVHQYFAVKVFLRISEGNSVFSRNHWLLIPPAIVDCLNIEETVMAKDARGDIWERSKKKGDVWGGGISSDPENKCVLFRDAVEGRHFWRVRTGNFGTYEYACSDEFWRLFRKGGLAGLHAFKRCELS